MELPGNNATVADCDCLTFDGDEHSYFCPAGEAERQAVYEAKCAKLDWLGKRDDDPAPGERGRANCDCRYCRFYRGEGGVRTIMCAQDWQLIPPAGQSDIVESCEG